MLLAHFPILPPFILLYMIIAAVVAFGMVVSLFVPGRAGRLIRKSCTWIIIGYSAFFWLLVLLYILVLK